MASLKDILEYVIPQPSQDQLVRGEMPESGLSRDVKGKAREFGGYVAASIGDVIRAMDRTQPNAPLTPESGLLGRVQDYWKRNAPAGLQNAVGALSRVGQNLGLSDPSSAFAPPIAPEVKAAKGILGMLKGAKTTLPAATYNEGVEFARMGATGKNVWVRRATPGAQDAIDNSKRTLMVQFSDKILSGPRNVDKASKADQYFDALYGGARPGYDRPADFWELPDWQTQIAKSVPNADTYVVRDMDEAIQFLNEADYGNVAMSTLDVNQAFVHKLAAEYPGRVSIGGYGGNLGKFKDLDNVKTYNSIQEMVEDTGHTYVAGNDYSNFKGTKTVPRLCLSTGCSHNCAFCTVEKTLKETPKKQIMEQVDAIAKDLPAPLVYLNDKTFGQAKNHTLLPEIYDKLKASNPDFQGFIVQTSPAQMTKMSPEFIDQAGIKYVELGVESVNDPILRKLRKPSNEKLLNDAADKIRMTDAKLIPNIMIGLPGETADTYGRTLQWLDANKDVVSHSNIYNLALYEEADLSKSLKGVKSSDFNENVLEKSWMQDPKVHQDFSDAVFDWSSEALGKKPLYRPSTVASVPNPMEATAMKMSIENRLGPRNWDSDKLSQRMFGKNFNDLSLDELRAFDKDLSR